MMECPICLSSSNDQGSEEITFVATSCNHSFCVNCIERALMKAPSSTAIRDEDDDDAIHLFHDPTMGKCPICRQNTSLFDLKSIPSLHHDGNSSSSSSLFIHEKNGDISSWPVAGLEFAQKASNRSLRDANEYLRYFVELKGAVEGYGITFRFHDEIPEIEFEIPLRVGKRDQWDNMRQGEQFSENQILLQKSKFTSWFYFDRTTSFHGKVSFDTPVCRRNNPKYFYDELCVVLQFSENKRYVRNGCEFAMRNEVSWIFVAFISIFSNVAFVNHSSVKTFTGSWQHRKHVLWMVYGR